MTASTTFPHRWSSKIIGRMAAEAVKAMATSGTHKTSLISAMYPDFEGLRAFAQRVGDDSQFFQKPFSAKASRPVGLLLG